MKRLLFLLLFLPIFVSAQNIQGNELRLRGKASIGEKGGVLDMNGNKVTEVADPTNPQDAVTLQYFSDNAFSTSMVLDSLMWKTNLTDLTVEKGKLYFDSTFQTLRFHPDNSNSIFIGRMLLNPVVINNSGALIPNLKVVCSDGEFNNRLTIKLADKSGFETSRVIGVTTDDIANGATGNVTNFGLIQGNTQGLYVGAAVGDDVYLDSSGNLTNQQATGGDFNAYIGIIKKLGVADGELYVNMFIENFAAEVISPRGWTSDVKANTIIFPTSGTRTVQILGSGYTYQDGVKYNWSNPSVQFNDVEGTHLIYFEGSSLAVYQNPTDAQVRDIGSSKAMVSILQWDAINDTIIFVNDMRHTFDMNGQTWSMAWDIDATFVLRPGIPIVDIQTEGTGNVDADAQFGNGSGTIRNQDIITSIPAVSGTTGYTIFYREGTSAWRSQDRVGFPVLNTTSLVDWNENVGGTWQLTEGGNGTFILYHLFAANTLGDKTGTVVGQTEYATLSDARNGALREIQNLVFDQFPIRELAPVGTVIFETRTNYSNGAKARTRQSTDPVTGELVDYIDWTKTGIAGGGGGGGIGGSFLDNSDTPSTYAGAANQSPIVNDTEDGLSFEPIVLTIGGETPTNGNLNLTFTNNKIGENVELNATGTNVSTTFSVADNDNSTTNEIQGLSNSKLNNTITITPSLGGAATTITDIARTAGFLNPVLNTSSLQTGGVERINSTGDADFRFIDASGLTTLNHGLIAGLGGVEKFRASSNGLDALTLEIAGQTVIDNDRNIVNAGSGNFTGRLGVNQSVASTAALWVTAQSGSVELARFTTADFGSGVGSSLRLFSGATSGDTDINIQALDAGGGSTSQLKLQPIGNAVVIGNPVSIGSEILAVGGNINVIGSGSFSNAITSTGFIRSGGLSSQFLKADGSVDSNSYLTGNQTITLIGDVTGSGTTSITTTVENDSHGHTSSTITLASTDLTDASNVALKNINNNFSVAQNITGGLSIGGTTVIDESRNIVNAGSGSFSGGLFTERSEIVNSASLSTVFRNTINAGNLLLAARTADGTEYNQLSVTGSLGVELRYEGNARLNTTSLGIGVTGTVTATSFLGSGSSLTSLNASNISSGTLADTRLSSNVALTNVAETFSSTVTATNIFKKATQTLSGTTPTYNCSNSVNAKITLTGNTTATLTNLTDGMSGNFYITQDGTGSHTLTLSPTPKVINGGSGVVTLTGTAGSTDIISWAYDGTTLYVTYGLNYN